ALFYIFSGVISAKYLSSFHEVLQDKTRMLFFTSCLVFSSIGIGAIAYKILFAELVGWKANLLNALSYMIGMLGLLYIYY
ncbi:transporter, partial [Salmonella enterica subsp. enterica serovar Typhimurium]|nr:transporter [Salmonella enterica subsp. enterica serovar Typhimurium]